MKYEPGTMVGLFAGIGGIEHGLARHGYQSELLCEWWEPAQAVLRSRFDGVTLHSDIRELRSLPQVEIVAAGFPCTDLSQAGYTRGIEGEQSGLVGEVFRLLRRRRAPVLVLENVRNMLVLDGGRAMAFVVEELEALGYRWAYRLVDSRMTGVPQRRQRVIMVAARDRDPRGILFADETPAVADEALADDAFGFYWTEGLRGLGWARDAIPTLKGGSTIGIPSPPAIWRPTGKPGRRVLVPGVEDAERLQGFPAGWTSAADSTSKRRGTRFKLLGNAVTVGIAEWVGSRIKQPGEPMLNGRQFDRVGSWPAAAWGAKGVSFAAELSMWPLSVEYRHLADVVDLAGARPLSARGAAGFLERAQRGSLRFVEGFLDDVAEHVDYMRSEPAVA